jgi:hypothetical protein
MSQLDDPVPSEGIALDALEKSSVAPSAAYLDPQERLFGMIFSPGRVFKDVTGKPTWLTPLIILILIGLASTLVVNLRTSTDWEQIVREQMRQKVEKTKRNMPPENVIKGQAAFNRKLAWYTSVGAGTIGVPIQWLLITVFFAFGLMAMDARTTFKKVFSVVLWGNCVPAFCSLLVLTAALLLQDPATVKITDVSRLTATNLGAVLPASTGLLVKTVASSIDLFTLWSLVLWSIGFAAISDSEKITVRKTGALVFGLWAIGIMLQGALVTVFKS